MRAVICLVALVCCWLSIFVNADLLPQPTPVYSTVVSAGFGNLGFSQHYSEYGNATAQFTRSEGRYYAPSAEEWTDLIGGNYYLCLELPGNFYTTCLQYPLTSVQTGLIVQGATALLVNMATDGVQFVNRGVTTTVRSQPAVRYSVTLTWQTSGASGQYFSIDDFINRAFATAGVDTSSPYTINAIIDVYYVSDSSGTMQTAGSGCIPLRFTIGGSRADANGNLPLNIVYDFMQFAALDTNTILLALGAPYFTPAPNTTLPQPIPASSPLLPINTTIPNWDGGLAIFELTASNHAPMQIDALLDSLHGQELLTLLTDPNTYAWNSLLYVYDNIDERNLQFANGAVYTLNGTRGDPYYDIDEYVTPICSGQTITPATVSPIQWLNAGSLNTMFANSQSFFSGAQSTGRQTIRGISTDTWVVNKAMGYNGMLYNFTLTVYVTSNGWNNLGRMNTQFGPQIIRLAYNGISTTSKGVNTPYTLQLDFFIQHSINWNPGAQQYNNAFNPAIHSCPLVSTGEPVLPQLPPQYTVTVSEVYTYTQTSNQYTMYVDTVRNLRRIDGLFTAPNTFALVSGNPNGNGNNYLNIIEWTQNVTLTEGFSSQTLSQGLPYTAFNPSQVSSCAAVTLLASDFSTSASFNFFDWLGQADASQATFTLTKNYRGVDTDQYLIALNSVNGGGSTVADFQVGYVSVDQTTKATIPLRATVTYFGSNFLEYNHYQFYNFRSSVPPGIFKAPNPASCTDTPVLPTTAPTNNYVDPDPYLDGTPMTAPTWPNTFALLIEGPLFASIGDSTIYTARWYTDFGNFRERLDIEPAFNMPGTTRVTPVTGTYVYYYNAGNANTFSMTDGTYVSYNGISCKASPITTTNMNPLKRVAPGNLFDTFFPQTTQSVSAQSTYNSAPRVSITRFQGFYYDEYDWTFNKVQFNGQTYNGTQSIFVTIPEWINNGQATNFSASRIPLSIQMRSTVLSASGTIVSSFNPRFALTHFQAINPGVALFDAALFGCATTPNSPWYNIQGTISSDSSSVNTSLIVGVVIGVIGGVCLLIFVGYYVWKMFGTNISKSLKYSGGMRSKGNGNENELAGVGKFSDNTAENSLNRGTLEKEGDLQVDEHGIVVTSEHP